MTTECNAAKLELEGVGRRRVEADFSGGQVSSDGGAVLARQAAERLRLPQRLAECFRDHRNPDLIEHRVEELLAQRIYGLVLGYEDLSDHEAISRDPLMATLVGKSDPEGKDRRHDKDRGVALASPSTLGRVERTPEDANESSRYGKVVCNFDALQEVFVQVFIESHDRPPPRLLLDLDPTDIELHGDQEGRFFHGYYRHHCYLPMYLFCGDYPLAVKLRPSNIDAPLGAVEMLAPVVQALQAAFPEVDIIIRGDSAFSREWLMSWCEQQGIEYVFGLARNQRLEKSIAKQMEKARRKHLQTGEPRRLFRDFNYRTLSSWSRKRRVVGKAEYLSKGANPRFVVTSLSAGQLEKRDLYEQMYCARGEMENRIKEQQLDLFADRASSHTFRGNEVRLWLSMAAHLLVVTIRRFGLADTELASAQAGTLRTKLFKIGAIVTVSVRRVYIRLSSAFPWKSLLTTALARLRAPPLSC
jgi:hypothetical protein